MNRTTPGHFLCFRDPGQAFISLDSRGLFKQYCHLFGWMTPMIRPSMDEYFMEIASVVAKRSTCLRNKVGALFVKNKRILTTGYNGAPAGLDHCDQVGCARRVWLPALVMSFAGRCMLSRMLLFKLPCMALVSRGQRSIALISLAFSAPK